MDADKRVVAIDRHEWMLKSPAHHTEVSKAIAVAEHERDALAAQQVHSGDVQVTAHDDLIVISFEAERPKNPKRGSLYTGLEIADA